MSFDHRTYNRERARRRKREWLQAHGPCKCGSWDNLEVDHIDSSQKSFSPSFTEGKAKLEAELLKCQVLCYTCHRAKTVACGETGGGQNKILDPQHGTCRMYELACRCDLCREWKRAYRNKEVDARGNTRS